MKGRIEEFKTTVGAQKGYLSTPKTSRGGVLVLHAWWGLNDFFKGFCDRLASEGYTAFAPDLFSGTVARTIDEAKELISKIDEGRNMNIVPPALSYLVSQPGVKGHHVGVVGFSMGAAWALWLSGQKPEEVKAVVVFYGTYPGVDISKSHAAYLGHYSPQDEWEPIEQIHSMEKQIKSTGRPVQFHVYPGTKHWFFEENRPEYDREASNIAWNRTLQFLHDNLKD